MRRIGTGLLAGGLVFLAGPAWATCASAPFDRVIAQSSTVWWATVTSSAPYPQPHRGVQGGSWILTVRIDRALKGSGSAGETATVFVANCGPPMLAKDVKREARAFVGQTRLFVGSQTGGGLAASSEVYARALSPQAQYRRALVDVNMRPSVTASGWRTMRFPWPEIAVTLGAFLVASGVLLLRGRRQDDGRPSRSEGKDERT